MRQLRQRGRLCKQVIENLTYSKYLYFAANKTNVRGKLFTILRYAGSDLTVGLGFSDNFQVISEQGYY